MLEIKNITKIYETEGFKQKALDNISVNFRQNEFASILGPSGSGKTTLLNIVGGLDHYTSGDLIINKISTKKYKDRDWDSYRNHRIGFVFQNYNLITHQTILSNVTLALTLSGVSKKDAITKAEKVLNDVGLKNHMNKKPNQLSGGQMQRVAIARALINDPDILLADEPTGALDSETSVQIMNLLKKIAKNKLVIMVTHNPDLANEYSNRIITLKDGKITSDTNPFDEKKDNKKETNNTKTKKTTMSLKTALGLSFNNLMTKKGRTILVSLAGSIGIIGIALILSLSTGFQNYIDKLQEDTLSSYPLTIMNESTDITGMLLSMTAKSGEDDKSGKVTEVQNITSMLGNIKSNDLKSFKNYLETNKSKIENDVTSINYYYSIDPLIYTIDATDKLSKVNPNNLFSSIYGSNFSTYSSYASIYTQMSDDRNSLEDQFELLDGKWPKEYNEMIIVLSEPNSISDLLIYSLGLRDTKELTDMVTKIMSGETVDINNEPLSLTYKDLMNVNLKLILPSDTYKYNEKYNIYEDMSEDEKYIEKLYNDAIPLKIVGVVCPKEGTSSMALTQGVAYTSSLIDYIINYSKNTDVVKKQLSNKDIDVFSNTDFDSEESNSNIEFSDLIKVDKDKIASAFDFDIDKDTIENNTEGYMQQISNSITTDLTPAKNKFDDSLNTLIDELFNSITSTISLSDVDSTVADYLNTNYSINILKELENEYVLPLDTFKQTYLGLLKGILQMYISAYYTVDSSLTTDISNPTAIVNTSVLSSVKTSYLQNTIVTTTSKTMSTYMTEALMKKTILTKVGELTGSLTSSLASGFNVDPSVIASSFSFDMSQEQLSRIMTAMGTTKQNNAVSNLITLGYQDKDDPSYIAFYFNSFDSKENFLSFIDNYNEEMKNNNEEDKEINYTDATGILMGSVKTVVNSVSYVLIAFVSISLVVSSIMIGIITYISVFERTKEIGILRAIGASKYNISSIFNAETFIIGLLSGLFGIGITYSLIPIINYVIHTLTGNTSINAVLNINGAVLLVILSIILTLIGGLIPAKAASKKDPVEALRSE